MKYSHLIVTERDLVRKACVRDIGVGNIPIKDIMSTLPLVAIDSRSPVEAAAAKITYVESIDKFQSLSTSHQTDV